MLIFKSVCETFKKMHHVNPFLNFEYFDGGTFSDGNHPLRLFSLHLRGSC